MSLHLAPGSLHNLKLTIFVGEENEDTRTADVSRDKIGDGDRGRHERLE